jgi:glycosyltransferase involved in cell wall biosynthesis
MKLLFLVDMVFKDKPGGSRVVARELARGLAQRGHEITLLAARATPQAPDVEEQDGIRIVRYEAGSNPVSFVRQGRRACAKLQAEHGFDLVHVHFAYSAVGPLQALGLRVPRLRFFHGAWDEEGWIEDQTHLQSLSRIQAPKRQILQLKSRLKRAVRRQIEIRNLHQKQKVVVLSEFMRGEANVRGVLPEDVHLIPGGTDVKRFLPAADPKAIRAALGLPPDCRLLLSVRRLAKRMGLDNLIQAMPAVLARYPDALLLIGGQGPEQKSLAKMIQDLKIEAHVRLLGFIPDDQLVQYYQAADVFVLPTVALEGFGLVTTEALACGLPVIGTPVGATPEILGGLEPRLITRGSAPQNLSEAIIGYFAEDWARALTRERLRRYVLDNYTWDAHVSAVEAVSLALVHQL